MSTCASCGLEILADSGLCRHHISSGDNWAEGNRIMCDFLHRKKLPSRLAKEHREEKYWAMADAS